MPSIFRFFFRLSLAMACAGLFASHAQSQSARAYLDRGLEDENERAALIAEGEQASFFCVYCHGEDGNSKISAVPNLAGQNARYVLSQIQAFLQGTRKDPFMEGLMRVLSPREQAAIAMFYAHSETIPASPEPGPRAEEGGRYYRELCARCHGEDARGAETYARLAGQQVEYLQTSLHRYLVMSSDRIYPAMTGSVRQLGERNIDAVVQYLSSLE